jgi:transposase InsO family protein
MKTKIPTRAGSTCNRRRRHSTLGYASPQQFLNNWLSSQREKELAA